MVQPRGAEAGSEGRTTAVVTLYAFSFLILGLGGWSIGPHPRPRTADAIFSKSPACRRPAGGADQADLEKKFVHTSGGCLDRRSSQGVGGIFLVATPSERGYFDGPCLSVLCASIKVPIILELVHL